MTFPPIRLQTRGLRLGVASATALGLLVALPGNAQAASQPTVGLGTAKSFAVLAGTAVTSIGATKVSGDLGLNPGAKSKVTGFPPGLVTNGTLPAADAVALQAQADLKTGYLDAAGRTPFVVVSKDLGGQTLSPGVYQAPKALKLTGTVILDAHNDPGAVFVFQAGSGLTTASTSKVKLVNGASSCNVFWQLTSSATLGSDSSFSGTILALTSISLKTRATVDGRLLARNGAVTLQANIIRSSPCTTGTKKTTQASQVSQVPKGSLGTGDGSTSGSSSDAFEVLLAGGLLAGVGGTVVFAARRRRENA